MADVWVLCKYDSGELTGIAIDLSEQAAKDRAADDGEYRVIPIQVGKRYPNIIDEDIVGAVPHTTISLRTLIDQAKVAIQGINDRLDTLEGQVGTIITQGQAMQQAIADLDARVTILEGT